MASTSSDNNKFVVGNFAEPNAIKQINDSQWDIGCNYRKRVEVKV